MLCNAQPSYFLALIIRLTYIHGSTAPLKKNHLPPQKINNLQFCTATASPCWNFPMGATVQEGMGLRLGLGVLGQAELGLGGQGMLGRWVREFLTTHHKASWPLMVKKFNIHYRSTAAPLRSTRNTYIFQPPPRHRPQPKTVIRGWWWTFRSVQLSLYKRFQNR